MLLSGAYPFMVKYNGDVSWVNDPKSHRISSLEISLWIMSTFVKWKFYELIFWTAHFQELWAHGIVSSQFLVKWVLDCALWKGVFSMCRNNMRDFGEFQKYQTVLLLQK